MKRARARLTQAAEAGLKELAGYLGVPADIFRRNAIEEYGIPDVNRAVPEALDFIRSARGSTTQPNPPEDCRGI